MNEKNRVINIAFVTAMDPQDKRAWSGILYHTAQALQKFAGEVTYIAPTGAQEKPGRQALYKKSRVFLKKHFAHHPLFAIGRKYFVCDYRIFTARRFVKFAQPKLLEQAFDVVVAPASTTEIAFLDTTIPIVLVEDATFASLHNYYPQYSNLPKGAVRQMNTLADRAIGRADLLVYASQWAANSAVADYGADKEKVFVVPMGANFDNPPPKEIIQEKQKSERCRLLFVGFDWQRKGGDIAFETLLKLEELGIEGELIVCGCTPPKQFAHPRMKVITHLDKNDPKQYRELEQLYLTSDFLLLPTRNECFGIVFCEANAFGLPIITTRTGGVPEVVRDGENGFVLPLDARGAEYAEVIAKTYRDDEQYTRLVISSRAAFDDRLNWDAWGKRLHQLITKMLNDKLSQGTTGIPKAAIVTP